MSLFSRLFRIPKAEQIRNDELADAQRDLLKYEAAVEYSIAMRDMLKTRVERLSTPQ